MNVELVRWPAESDRRKRLRDNGVPIILVVEGPATAPVCSHALEDWVRPPISREDLDARRASLLARAVAGSAPWVDDDDILHHGAERLHLARAEAQLMRALCACFGSVASRDELVEQLWPGSGRARRNALDLRVLRLRRRIEPLRLTIGTAWGRGYVLDGVSAGLAELSHAS